MESRLGVTNAQLIVAHRDLDDSKTLLSDAQRQLLEIQNRLSTEQQEHLVTKQHLLIAQQALSDFQDTQTLFLQLNNSITKLIIYDAIEIELFMR